jgi:hypothetical protein
MLLSILSTWVEVGLTLFLCKGELLIGEEIGGWRVLGFDLCLVVKSLCLVLCVE